MKKIALITIATGWILSLIVLAIALTNIYPINVLSTNRMIVGIGFLTISWLLKSAYRKRTVETSSK